MNDKIDDRRGVLLKLLGVSAGVVVGPEATAAKEEIPEANHAHFNDIYRLYVLSFVDAMPLQYNTEPNSVMMCMARAHAVATATAITAAYR